jgi:hypothetical protein
MIAAKLIILVGCQSNHDPCEKAKKEPLEPMTVNVQRMDQELFNCTSRSQIIEFTRDNRDYANKFLNRREFPNDSLFYNSLQRLINDPYLDTIRAEVDKYFGDFSQLEYELGLAFARIKKEFPDFNPPVVQTGITGFATDLVVTPGQVIIGLDFFLGRFGTYRPQQYPSYIAERFEAEYIVPNIVLHLSRQYNELDPNNDTFLADMIYYGKSYLFTKHALPCISDALIIQYKEETLKEVRENEEIIWASILQNELLYETSHFIKRKFLEERPSVPEIGTKCPGRIGAWMGWRVMQSYQKRHKEIRLQEVMKMTDADQLFSESGYKPNVGS